MPMASYRTTADQATPIPEALDRFARTDGRPVALVAQELYYRALFDGCLTTGVDAGVQAQMRRRERFEVLLRQTKNALRDLGTHGADAARHDVALSSSDREGARPRA